MEKRYYMINIVVLDRESAYNQVNELLHQYANLIKLRVGYPVEEEGFAVIFVVVKATNDEVGSFAGKLGKIPKVKVKSTLVK
ncbi:TM1266 family iron-only hydrogenase system putative regulator [Pseudothermotoga thermarum]|uniref:Iron-only hydrogenase system regulator n=1 Tax=Pseudothermotoga thermarum DSM 5069 TaxID=688269 RepID=F7YUM4_9THEM|nr:TM1266 family iron-only hydrogenase system putative regulator [Pseudothermotoga thermarum]AEH50209.1 hypothetical protein Theth_0103 [Pseudothermotoga thermarum DSM 5069]